MPLALVVALSAAALYGVSDFLGALGAGRLRVIPATTICYAFAAVALAVAVLVLRSNWSSATLESGIAAGLCAIVGFLTFFAAMAAGPMSLVSPIVAVLESVVPLSAAVALGERLGAITWVAIGFAVVSGVLITLNRGQAPVRISARTATLSVVAGLALGGSVVALHSSPRNSGIVPAFIEVLTGLAVLGILGAAAAASGPVRALLSRLDEAEAGSPVRATGAAWILSGASGVILGAANAFLVIGLRLGSLAVVAVLVNLYPLATILLARIVSRERLARIQLVGVGFALVASVLFAAS